MFAKNAANSVDEYIAQVPEGRHEIIVFLHDLIQKTAPKLKPHFAYNMLGYGGFEYLDKRTKEMKPWPIVALANQKNYVSLYVCAINGQEYLAEKYKDQLGKVNVGRSCIRFKKLENLNLETVKKLIKEAEQSPGMVGAETRSV